MEICLTIRKKNDKVFVMKDGNADLKVIPGIGKTFVNDFLRIGIREIKDLKNKSPEILFKKLQMENEKLGHKTSKNYLYILRMAVYYAGGGRDPEKLKWNVWKEL